MEKKYRLPAASACPSLLPTLFTVAMALAASTMPHRHLTTSATVMNEASFSLATALDTRVSFFLSFSAIRFPDRRARGLGHIGRQHKAGSTLCTRLIRRRQIQLRGDMDSISAQSKTDMGEKLSVCFFPGSNYMFPYTSCTSMDFVCIRFVVCGIFHFSLSLARRIRTAAIPSTQASVRGKDKLHWTRDGDGSCCTFFVGRDWAKGARAMTGEEDVSCLQ